MATIEWRGKKKDIAYLSWSDGHNGQTRRSLGKIPAWQAEEIRLEKERRQSSPIPQFKPFVEEYLDWHKFEYPSSHNRIYQIVHQYLIPTFKSYPLDTITEYELEGYKARRNAKAETINKELRTINAILNRAVRWKQLSKNPISDLPIIKVLDSKPPHFYTLEELRQLYEYSKDFIHKWQFLANTGLRRAEYLNFNPSHHIRDGVLVIESNTGARTKSGKWRQIPIGIGAREAMEHDYLYQGRKESLSRAFAKCAKRADLPGSLHSLRHSFCSHLVMNSVPLRTVQKLAGHSTMTITEKYAHLSPDHLANSVQHLNL